MALTQSARLPGPSWDDEVVPALRKRLESESRTLAKRMSAISLSSVDEPTNANYSAYSDQSTWQRSNSPPPNGLRQQSSSSKAQRTPLAYQQQQGAGSDRTMTATASRVNGTTAPPASTFQRPRTYSSPFASDHPNGHVNGNARPKIAAAKSADPTRSLSPRPVDVKPTRIPKASRPPISVASSSASSPYSNSYSHGNTVTSSTLSPELTYQALPGGQRMLATSSSSQSIELSRSSRQTPGLLGESPPFPTDSTLSSGFSQPAIRSLSMDEDDPPRASMESEERPYEHWYRGEVSRNGGVGELRVGRRQEMLDIANYGHLIENKKKLAANRKPPTDVNEVNSYRNRKRAGSIAGITPKERQRGSLYLEEENLDEAGQVLDEPPLTDLDGEGSEVHSTSDHYSGIAYAYLPGVGDISTPSSQQWTTVAGAHQTRSGTPTQASTSLIPRSSSRQQNIPPTRIPGPSSRRSSESRSTVTTSPVIGGPNISMQSNSSSSKTTPPPSAPSSSTNSRQQLSSNNTSPNNLGQKRGVSPASKNQRAAAAKMAKSKTTPTRKEGDNNRGSVAYYPSPGDGDDMADAIPSWTQPVPREGNWDDVVLPVVARKKGLNGYYEEADGSPKPKKTGNHVEPAPGTFGFDHSKYRPPRADGMSIPMDEFGRPTKNDDDAADEEEEQDSQYLEGKPNLHDETQLPTRQGQSPSPAPFAHYAPNTVQVRAGHPGLGESEQKGGKQQRHPDDDDGGSGCCKCVIM